MGPGIKGAGGEFNVLVILAVILGRPNLSQQQGSVAVQGLLSGGKYRQDLGRGIRGLVPKARIPRKRQARPQEAGEKEGESCYLVKADPRSGPTKRRLRLLESRRRHYLGKLN